MLSLCLALYGLAVSPVLDPKPLREVFSLPDGLNGHRLTVDVYSGAIVYATQKEVFRSNVLEDVGLLVHKNPDNDHLVIVGSRDQGLLIEMKTWKVRSRFSARLAAYNSEFGLVKVFGGEHEPQRIRVG